jgi:hypothetical protein
LKSDGHRSSPIFRERAGDPRIVKRSAGVFAAAFTNHFRR